MKRDSHGRLVVLPGIQFLASDNQSTRGDDEPELVVMHYTAGGRGRGTANWLVKEEARRSAHFVGARDGWIGQLVPLDRKAWHAGVSEWRRPSTGETDNDVNTWSIGIEIANWGWLQRDNLGQFWSELGGTLQRYQGDGPVHAVLTYDNGTEIEGWWEPYPQVQIDAVRSLLELLAAEGWPTELVGHEEIAMPFATRKRDPGPVIPWEQLGRIPAGRRTSARIIEAGA